jgi:hypothetical protein
MLTQMVWTAGALVMPFAGVWRACKSIANARPFEKDPIERAKYAGALCMVDFFTDRGMTELRSCRISGKVPSEATGDEFVECIIKTNDASEWFKTRGIGPHLKIHGCSGIKGDLSIVPPYFKVFSNCDASEKVGLSCSSSLLKCATAVVQLCFACFVLYRTRSNQVDEFGYAAFGLTVIPYAVMSLINLTANLLTPEYPTLFVVHSEYMDTLQQLRKERIFDGTIGTVAPKSSISSDGGVYTTVRIRTPIVPSCSPGRCDIQIPDEYVEDSEGRLEVEISAFGRHEIIAGFQKQQKIRNAIGVAIGTVALITPYVLIAIFSGFHAGSLSTPLQRGFVMLWLVGGQVFGALVGLSGQGHGTKNAMPIVRSWPWYMRVSSVVLHLAFVTPAVGGFVVVGLMIKQFGSCELV